MSTLYMLMGIGFAIVALAVVLAPLVWAGYRIYANGSVWSLTRRVGTIVLGVFGTFVVGVGIVVVMFVIGVSFQPFSSNDIRDYHSTIEYYRFSEHVRHFPTSVDTSRVLSFERWKSTLPDLSSKVSLHMRLTKEQAKRIHAVADRQAQWVITWADSAGTEQRITERDNHLTNDLPSRTYLTMFLRREPASDYIGYVFSAQPYRRGTETATSQIGHVYGIAFHKHRREVIYWTFEWTY